VKRRISRSCRVLSSLSGILLRRKRTHSHRVIQRRQLPRNEKLYDYSKVPAYMVMMMSFFCSCRNKKEEAKNWFNAESPSADNARSEYESL
jgi:hypothetical protein